MKNKIELEKVANSNAVVCELVLTLLQLARDYWSNVINSPTLAGRANYEKYQVRSLLSDIERKTKTKMISKCGERGREVAEKSAEKVADNADILAPLVDECIEKTMAAIVQSMPYNYQRLIVDGVMVTYFLYCANSAQKLISGNDADSRTIMEAFEIVNDMPARFEYPVWKDMDEVIRPEWCVPIINEAVRICNADRPKKEVEAPKIPQLNRKPILINIENFKI